MPQILVVDDEPVFRDTLAFNLRRDGFDAVAAAKKDKAIGEDDAKRLEKQIDDALSSAKAEIDAAAKAKEVEIMTI